MAKTDFGLKEGAGLVHGAPLSVVNRSEQVIRKAIKRKYRQARNVEMPVLVAIKAEGFFRHLEDFDTALFGHYRFHLDQSRSFKADGVFAREKEGEPIVAGVLAFTEVGNLRCSEPVLYIHPRFTGGLPNALRQLEQRNLLADRSGIEVLESHNRGFLAALGFADGNV